MFRFFGRKKEASQVVCHKCGAALRSDDTYMLNGQKYCGKCYQEEKKNNETIPAKDTGHPVQNVKKESPAPAGNAKTVTINKDFFVRMERCLAQRGYETYVRKCWNDLNARMKDENDQTALGLFQIHMGAFDDLRTNGHRVTMYNEPLSIYAASLEPEKRFDLAAEFGRSLIKGSVGKLNYNPAIMCSVDQADYFPNCIAIGLAAILQYLHPGIPGIKMGVVCFYDTFKGNDDPFGKLIRILEPCFPWVDFRTQATKKEKPAPVKAPVLPLKQMAILFKADNVHKIAPGRAGFSGTVIRGEIHKGDTLTVTDGKGQQIAAPGLVMDLSLKDRTENGEIVCEKTDIAANGQHLDCLLVAVELPKGSYNGIMLCGEKQTDDESFDDLLTSQLAAYWQNSSNEKYKNEYLRRLRLCGLSDENAEKTLEFECGILRNYPRPEMLKNSFVRIPLLTLREPFLKEPLKYYETHFEYPLSYIFKLSDEGERHFHYSHELDLSDEVWSEIYGLSDRNMAMFRPFAMHLINDLGWTIENVNHFSFYEQKILDVFRWGYKRPEATKIWSAEQHL